MGHERLTCSWCSEKLDDEQSANPLHDTDGGVMCDDCHDDEYRGICHRCENVVDKTEIEANPGEVIAILHRADGLSSEIGPGYYRVKEWPFFADGMIEAYFYDDHLEKISDLDEPAIRAAAEIYSCSIPLCSGCRRSISASVETETT